MHSLESHLTQMLGTGSVSDFSVFDFFFLNVCANFTGQVRVVKLKTQIHTKFQI